MKGLFSNKGKAHKKETPRLHKLDVEEPAYVHVRELFEGGWLHPNKPKPFIHSIFEIRSSETLMQPFHDYLNTVQDTIGPWGLGDAQRLLFHGTVRACALGETSTSILFCGSPKCSVCCISRGSFEISKCGTKNDFSRFGAGIYTTSCSSKADDYTFTTRDGLQLRALLVSSVVVGKAHEMTRTSTKMVGPPPGTHSVLGVPGEDLNYEETVVYTNEAIRPLYLIVYGDAPEPKKRRPLKSLFNTPLVS